MKLLVCNWIASDYNSNKQVDLLDFHKKHEKDSSVHKQTETHPHNINLTLPKPKQPTYINTEYTKSLTKIKYNLREKHSRIAHNQEIEAESNCVSRKEREKRVLQWFFKTNFEDFLKKICWRCP